MAGPLYLTWTGEVGQRDLLANALKPFNVIMTDSVKPTTRAIVVGKSPKAGKLSEAQLYNIPQVKPDFLTDFAKIGHEPSLQPYLMIPVEMDTDTRPKRRHSSNWSGSAAPPSPARGSPKKRMLNSVPWSNEPAEHVTEHARPTKKACLDRSMSSSSGSGSGASFGSRKAMHDASHIRYASEEQPGAALATGT